MSEVNLQQIRQVEKESDRILDEAETKMEEAIKTAHEEAENIRTRAKKDAETEAEELRSSIEEETEKEISALDKEASSRKEKLREAKKSNLAAATKIVVEKVIEF